MARHRPGAKRDLLVAGLSWGHMPMDLVAEDVAQGRLVELRRRAWHLRSLVFVFSCLRGSKLSPFEERAVQLLAGGPATRSRDSRSNKEELVVKCSVKNLD